MFTGIIQNLGTVQKKDGKGLRVTSGKKLSGSVKPGDSVAVNGVCLTVIRFKNPADFWVDIMPETWKKTMLGNLRQGDKVNLELAIKASQPLGGHMVQGHVDGVAKIKSIKKAGNSRIFTFTTHKNIAKYLLAKGSVTINGISLTLIKVSKSGFQLGIIPYTWQNTTLRYARVGDRVNVEADMIAKYIQNFLNK